MRQLLGSFLPLRQLPVGAAASRAWVRDPTFLYSVMAQSKPRKQPLRILKAVYRATRGSALNPTRMSYLMCIVHSLGCLGVLDLYPYYSF